MKPIVVHIGHPKTGSSAIQHHLKINRARLKEYGYRYPMPARLLDAKSKISSGNGRMFLHFDKPPRRVVFSNEQLSAPEHYEDRSVFLRQLETYRDDLRIILFTRDLIDHFLSAWGQFIKRGGGTRTVDEYAHGYSGFSHIAHIVRVLERQGIAFTLRNYSRMDDAVGTFMRLVLGRQADAYLAGAEFDHSVINRSLTLAETELQRRLNMQFGKELAGRIADDFVDHLPDLPAQRPLISQQAVDQLQRNSADAITYLNGFLPKGEEIATQAPPGVLAGPDAPPQEYRFSAAQLDLIARFCYARHNQGGNEE